MYDKIIQISVIPVPESFSDVADEAIYGISENGNLYSYAEGDVGQEWFFMCKSPVIQDND